MQPYTITLECDFSEFWRYNLIVQGQVTNQGEPCNYFDHSDVVAPVGSNLAQPPANHQLRCRTVLESKSGDGLQIYIYIIPHTLPQTNLVSESKPFEFCVQINQGDRSLYKHRYLISQWSGRNIQIAL